jgi:hypothetical protein
MAENQNFLIIFGGSFSTPDLNKVCEIVNGILG